MRASLGHYVCEEVLAGRKMWQTKIYAVSFAEGCLSGAMRWVVLEKLLMNIRMAELPSDGGRLVHYSREM
jgi:hypothetical protein